VLWKLFQALLFNNLFTLFFIICCFLLRYNGYMRESMFSVGLQRIASSDIDTVKEIIDETFEKVIE